MYPDCCLCLALEFNQLDMFFREYTKSYPKAKYLDDTKPWAVKCDIAFPCATQNELNHADAMSLINVGCQIIIEGKSSCL